MLRTGTQFYSIFQDAPHCSATLNEDFDGIWRMLRAGAQFSSKNPGCSARERDFLQDFQEAPHGSAILNEEVDERTD